MIFGDSVRKLFPHATKFLRTLLRAKTSADARNILGALGASDINFGDALVMEMGISLTDNARIPEMASNAAGEETFVRTWTNIGPLTYLKRWSKGGIRMNRNAGKAGSRIQYAIDNFTRDIVNLKEKPKYIFFWHGGNDLFTVVPDETTGTVEATPEQAFDVVKNGYTTLIGLIKSQNIVPIIIDFHETSQWQQDLKALQIHYKLQQWTEEYCKLNKISLVSIASATSRALTQIFIPVTVSRILVSNVVTMSIAPQCVVSYTAHGHAAGQPIKFTTTGGLPSGGVSNVVANQTYYVIATDLTANTYKFSAIVGGVAIDTSGGSQSGTHSEHGLDPDKPQRPAARATVEHTAHPFITGDFVVLQNSTNLKANQPSFKRITVVNANAYTLWHNNGLTAMSNAEGTLTSQYTEVLRGIADAALMNDGLTHFTEKSARRIAKKIWAQIQPAFPPKDILSNSNNDYYNLVGCGRANAIGQVSLAYFNGTGGNVVTIQGYAPVLTGSMPNDWTIENENANGTAPLVTVTLVPCTDDPYQHLNWLQLAITADATGLDNTIFIYMTHDKPAAWTATTAVTSGTTTRRPTTETGLFAACIKSGTTASAEPTWPTRIGSKVGDGADIAPGSLLSGTTYVIKTIGTTNWVTAGAGFNTVGTSFVATATTSGTGTVQAAIWEMRAGWKDGDTIWAGMEYSVTALMDSSSLANPSFGLHAVSDGSLQICDGSAGLTSTPPEWEVGETGYFVTAEAKMKFDIEGKFKYGLKLGIKATSKTATIRLRRPVLRKVGLAA